MNKILRELRMMKSIAIVIIVVIATSMFGIGLVLANINLERYNQLIDREEIIQRDWVEFSLGRGNKSLQIISMQAERVKLLEGKLENANIVMQATTSDLKLRERLLVSTAKQLQEVIDALAVAKIKLDSDYRKIKYLHLRIASLSDSLYKVQKRVKELKKELEVKEPPKPFLSGIYNLEGLL